MELDAITEEWFLGALESTESDVPGLLAVFNAMSRAGRGDEADGWAQLLFQKRAADNDTDNALRVLEWLAVVRNSVEDVRGSVEKLLSRDANALKMIEPAGFGGRLPEAECFRRLYHLRALKIGTLCYNPTWGCGTVEDIDYFYQNIEVDFETRGEHEMAFSYAAEALEILADDHLLAIRHRQPAELEQLIREEPAEVVRIALRSYGPMPVTRLQETLSPSILPEADWKKFWAAARGVLKNDASVEIPRKRSDNIVLHQGEQTYGDEWFARIASESDIEVLFERFNEIVERKIDCTTETAREVLSNRLSFIIKGAPSARPEWKAGGFIYARTFNIEPKGLDTARLIRELVSGDLVTTLERLPSRHLQVLLSILMENDREAVVATLSEVIPVVSHPVLNEIMASLIANGAEAEVREIMASALARRTASAPMLLWCQRSTDRVAQWELISTGDLAFRIQEVLEVNSTGAMLRAQNQLRERFQQEAWLHQVMRDMQPQQRRDFLRRIHEGHGWDVLDRKSVVAKVLRRFPELQDIILPPKGSEPVKKEIPHTSSRSYAERQRQLERIMTVEIPENSKEIEVARSYGDLRENAEFKYAKERQGLLMAQGAQLAEDLERVKPTDFANVPLDAVAMGTGVQLVYPGGAEETFFILGAWDKNESLSIISSETALARALIGHRAGDQVAIPAGECEIRAVLPLSDAVRAWIKG